MGRDDTGFDMSRINDLLDNAETIAATMCSDCPAIPSRNGSNQTRGRLAR